MRKGDVYVIGTEEEAGMGLDSCDQDWSSVSALENNSIQLAYFYNSTAEFMSPVVQLSQRKIVLDACVSIALHLECSKSLKSPKGNYAFLVCGLLVWLPFCSLLECCPWSHSTSSDRQGLDFWTSSRISLLDSLDLFALATPPEHQLTIVTPPCLSPPPDPCRPFPLAPG
ncbi:uncharacterized protein [Lepisosteus oculatus]